MTHNAAVLESTEPESLESSTIQSPVRLLQPVAEDGSVGEIEPIDLLLARVLRDGRYIYELTTQPEEVAERFAVDLPEADAISLKTEDLDEILAGHYERCFADGPASARDPSASAVGIDIATVVVGTAVGTVVGILVSEAVVTYKSDGAIGTGEGDLESPDPFGHWFRDDSEHRSRKI